MSVSYTMFLLIQPPYDSDVQRIVPQLPVIAQFLRIKIRKNEKVSICLRAEVYGCGIPRGKILSFLNTCFYNARIWPWFSHHVLSLKGRYPVVAVTSPYFEVVKYLRFC